MHFQVSTMPLLTPAPLPTTGSALHAPHLRCWSEYFSEQPTAWLARLPPRSCMSLFHQRLVYGCNPQLPTWNIGWSSVLCYPRNYCHSAFSRSGKVIRVRRAFTEGLVVAGLDENVIVSSQDLVLCEGSSCLIVAALYTFLSPFLSCCLSPSPSLPARASRCALENKPSESSFQLSRSHSSTSTCCSFCCPDCRPSPSFHILSPSSRSTTHNNSSKTPSRRRVRSIHATPHTVRSVIKREKIHRNAELRGSKQM